MIARDPVLGLFAFYAVRGVPLDALAAYTAAERGFLEGARALYYEDQIAVIQAAIAGLFPGGDTVVD